MLFILIFESVTTEIHEWYVVLFNGKTELTPLLQYLTNDL